MHIQVSDMRIKNYNILSDYIPFCSDIEVLISLSNELSTHIINKDILANDADELFALIKNRLYTLNNNSKGNLRSKRLALFKEGSRPTTSVSSQEGIIITSLLVLNIIITLFMYTMLFIIRFTK